MVLTTSPARVRCEMAEHIVCLTFDFDTVSGWIANGFVTPTPISRGEFGLVGAERILDLLRDHGIRSTWFIPGVTLETYPAACQAVAEGNHEIAHHGWRTLRPRNSHDRRRETLSSAPTRRLPRSPVDRHEAIAPRLGISAPTPSTCCSNRVLCTTAR